MTEGDRPDDGGPAASDETTTPRCPVCGRPRDQGFRPFCSKRCRDVDLGRWLTGAYAIAGEPDSENDER